MGTDTAPFDLVWRDPKTPPDNERYVLVTVEDGNRRYVGVAFYSSGDLRWMGAYLTSHRRVVAWAEAPPSFVGEIE